MLLGGKKYGYECQGGEGSRNNNNKIKWKMMSEMKINEHDLWMYVHNMSVCQFIS